MPEVQRNVVTPPNEEMGELSERLSMRPTAGASPVDPPNMAIAGMKPGMSAMGTREASPVDPPNLHFGVDLAQIPQPQSAVEPGRGTVPIRPFTKEGKPSMSLPVSEMAPAKR